MAATIPSPAVLVLEDGSRYRGRAYGAEGRTVGEAVFSTGMTGYQETLTDPSYAGQIVLQTAPHIGNTGMNDEDMESSKIWVAGYIVRDPSRVVSNFRSERSLDDDLVASGVVGISGIDTRAVTRHLRSAGAMRAGIFSGADAALSDGEQLELVRSGAEMAGQNLSGAVSTQERYDAAGDGRAHRLGRRARPRRQDLHAELPRRARLRRDRAAADRDGRGDPRARARARCSSPTAPATPAHPTTTSNCSARCCVPTCPTSASASATSCSAARSASAPTSCRSATAASTSPCIDVSTGRVEITAHNHGFAVDAPLHEVSESAEGFGRVEVSHYDLNDNVVEGLNCLDIPAFSVQYHPESAAGPHDANYLFDRFRDMVLAKNSTSATTDGDQN